MDDQNLKDVESMEKEAKYHIIHIDDDHQSECKNRILDEFTAEVTDLFTDFKAWLKENNDPDKVAAYKEKVRLETALQIQKVKIAIAEINENEKVKSGKDAVMDASRQFSTRVQTGVQDFMKNEKVQKAVSEVSTKVHQIKEDERVKETVKKVKKGTLHIAGEAYGGLKKVLEEHDDVKTPTHDLPNEPEE